MHVYSAQPRFSGTVRVPHAQMAAPGVSRELHRDLEDPRSPLRTHLNQIGGVAGVQLNDPQAGRGGHLKVDFLDTSEGQRAQLEFLKCLMMRKANFQVEAKQNTTTQAPDIFV